jgi:type II secretory pathway pseudopilin PulG
VEVLVVISIIGILLGLTTVAMMGGKDSEVMMKSRNHLRQIAQWMDQYSASHRDTVVPSRFNYLDEDGVDTDGDGVIDSPDVNRVGGARFFTSTGAGDDWLSPPTANPFRTTGDLRADGLSQGSWADILWVDANLGSSVNFKSFPVLGAGSDDVYGGYGADSVAAPGWWLYSQEGNRFANPLRSAGVNSFDYPKIDANGVEFMAFHGNRGLSNSGDDPEGRALGLPTPLGAGAWEKGLPGFFAANNFFDARSRRDITGSQTDPFMDRFVTHGQVRAPARSLYIVDSFRGESIGGSPLEDRTTYEARTQAAFTNDILGDTPAGVASTQEVDFRYSNGDSTLMLFLDGHVGGETAWRSWRQLAGDASTGDPGRGIRVLDLDTRLQP